jgi:hypothetical protein
MLFRPEEIEKLKQHGEWPDAFEVGATPPIWPAD